MTTKVTAQTTKPKVDSRRWVALIVILAATFMAILDTFIVNVAIPSIQRGLHTSFAQVQLVIASYTLTYAVLLITGGRLGDMYKRKRLFQIGMLTFTVMSLFCGLAPNATFLIIARILQGVGAALMIPQVLSLIQVSFLPEEKGIAFGFYGATVGLASIAGQILGGFLISSDAFGLGWRNVFLVNVPIGILAIIAAIPLIHEPDTQATHKLDLIGVGILCLGLFLLTYPLVEGHDTGWPLWIFICLILTIPVLIAFVLYERRLIKNGGTPLLPLSLFRERSFDLGTLTVLVFYSGNAALFFVLALYLQDGLGFSAFLAGLTFLPLGIGFAITSLGAPRLVPHLGGPWVLRGGAFIMAIGEAWTLFTVQQAGFLVQSTQLLLPLLLVGLGEGTIAAPLINTVLGGIRSENAGAASGILSTTTQIANGLGIALIGIIFFAVIGTGTQTATKQAIHTYGQAFVASSWAIIVMALATLLFVSLLPPQKQKEQK